jgi:hypothetical protein
MTNTMTIPTAIISDAAQERRIRKALARQSYCVLATTSGRGNGHAAGVIYEFVDDTLYVHTMRTSRKARNVASNPNVGIVVSVRRMPVGPPFSVQFQATADVLAMDHPHIVGLLANGRLRKISGHGALDDPEGCFLRIRPLGTVHSYGIGVSVLGLIKDPLHAGARVVALSPLDASR